VIAAHGDEFRGGTSAGGVTGDMTGSELASFVASYVSVMGHNSIPPQGSHTEILRYMDGWPMESRWGFRCSSGV